MNVVLSLMQRDQWTAQKIRFWTYRYCICFVVYSGSAQNLPLCPINKSSIWRLEAKLNYLGVNYQESSLWWLLQQIISLPYPATSHWWVSIFGYVT